MTAGVIASSILIFLAIVILAKTAVVVPQQAAYVVERLGRYSGTLQAGFHILTPFVDVIATVIRSKKPPSIFPNKSASRAITFKSGSMASSI